MYDMHEMNVSCASHIYNTHVIRISHLVHVLHIRSVDLFFFPFNQTRHEQICMTCTRWMSRVCLTYTTHTLSECLMYISAQFRFQNVSSCVCLTFLDDSCTSHVFNTHVVSGVCVDNVYSYSKHMLTTCVLNMTCWQRVYWIWYVDNVYLTNTLSTCHMNVSCIQYTKSRIVYRKFFSVIVIYQTECLLYSIANVTVCVEYT